jgi:hypothetical protein
MDGALGAFEFASVAVEREIAKFYQQLWSLVVSRRIDRQI